MDFKKIISSTHNYNFHSHTQFCDGRADMETMARAAVACGMEHYGFSPHSRSMTDEERAVVDSFDGGEENYNKVFENRKDYLIDSNGLLMLAAGGQE